MDREQEKRLKDILEKMKWYTYGPDKLPRPWKEYSPQLTDVLSTMSKDGLIREDSEPHMPPHICTVWMEATEHIALDKKMAQCGRIKHFHLNAVRADKYYEVSSEYVYNNSVEIELTRYIWPLTKANFLFGFCPCGLVFYYDLTRKR